jgi:hypothetical protein
LLARQVSETCHLQESKEVKKLWFVAFMCAFVAVPALAQQVAEKGKMLVASNGARLGAVYRVGADGSAQLIIDGKMVTVPASTLAVVDGKLTTTLTKSEVLALH